MQQLLIYLLITFLWVCIIVVIFKQVEPLGFTSLRDRLQRKRVKMDEDADENQNTLAQVTTTTHPQWVLDAQKEMFVVRKETLRHYDRGCRCVKQLMTVMKITDHYTDTWRTVNALRRKYPDMPRSAPHFIFVPGGQKIDLHFPFAIHRPYLFCITGQNVYLGEEQTTLSFSEAKQASDESFTLLNQGTQAALIFAV